MVLATPRLILPPEADPPEMVVVVAPMTAVAPATRITLPPPLTELVLIENKGLPVELISPPATTKYSAPPTVAWPETSMLPATTNTGSPEIFQLPTLKSVESACTWASQASTLTTPVTCPR